MSTPTIQYGGSQPALRGSPLRKKDLMEQFQQSYVQGVASAAGCVISEPRIDEGIDLMLTHRAGTHMGDHVARLEVQLKATAHRLSADGSKISASLRRDRYDYFRSASPTVPKIVVIMLLPDDQDKWVVFGSDSLRLHHAAYWVNIDGFPPTDQPSITVSAPTTNKFSDVALCHMMERIGQGGKP